MGRVRFGVSQFVVKGEVAILTEYVMTVTQDVRIFGTDDSSVCDE